jgi:hypothetical protein
MTFHVGQASSRTLAAEGLDLLPAGEFRVSGTDGGMPGSRTLHRVVLVVVVTCFLLGISVAGASADLCSNEQLRLEAHSTSLPDCRAYEMVSPVEKNGSDVLPFLLDTRSGTDGARVAFSSTGAFAGATHSKGVLQYIATRGGDGWSTRFPAPAVNSNPNFPGSFVQIFSDDLNQYVLGTADPDPVSGLEEGRQHIYAAGEVLPLRPLASMGTPGTSQVVGASADFSHIVFESVTRLTPEAPIDDPSGNPLSAATSNLYENVDGNLSLVGILPDGTPAPNGAFAGYYNGPGGVGGAAAQTLTQDQHVVSTDGSRIFWTSVPDGQLYVRINGTTTVQVSASQRSTPDPDGTQPAQFRYATPDGSRVFFTSPEKLTDNSTAVSGGAPEPDLYVFDVDSGALTDLSVDPTAGEAANVGGVVGASEDGSSVYFAAQGHLTPDSTAAPDIAPDATTRPKIYLWHDGTLTYVTTMAASSENNEELGNWAVDNSTHGVKQSRVSSDGRYMLVRSVLPLTSYDSGGFDEFYRYDAETSAITCVSCDPSGLPPTSDASAGFVSSFFGNSLLSKFETNNMSTGGSRIFFDTSDALVSQDTNGAGDVYEWENGQVHLISSGRSPEDSYFAEATPSGSNVFFTTREQLTGQDSDKNVDLYDAREEGGYPEPSRSTRCVDDQCQGQGPAAPVFEAPGSATFSGSGTIAQAPTQPEKSRVKEKTASQVRAEALEKALKACRAKRNRHRRSSCEASARKKYGVHGKETDKSKRDSRGTK